MRSPARAALITLTAIVMSLGACGEGDDAASTTTTSETSAGSNGGDDPTTTSTEGTIADTPVSDPADIAARLEAAGLGCENFVESADPNPEVDRSGECTLADGRGITIDAFESAERYDAYVQLGEAQGCAFFAGGIIAWAAGEHWAVAISLDPGGEMTSDVDGTQALADALDGDLETIDC